MRLLTNGLSIYTNVTLWLSLFTGVCLIVIGIYFLAQPDIDVTVIKASVTSVTWNGKDHCGVSTSSNKEGESSVVYHCDVVTKYKENNAKEDDAAKEDNAKENDTNENDTKENDTKENNAKEDDAYKKYEFYSASSTRYNIGDEIDIYKYDGIVSQLDPNAWKSLAWIPFIFGAIILLVSLFWLWVCSRSTTACAIYGATQILGGLFGPRDP